MDAILGEEQGAGFGAPLDPSAGDAARVTEQFLRFLESYTEAPGPEGPEDDTTPPARHYVEQAVSLITNLTTTLFVDFGHVAAYSEDLAEVIEFRYYQVETALRRAVQTLCRRQAEIAAGPGGASQIADVDYWVSFFNLAQVQKVRDLRTDKIGRLTCVTGTVTRTSEVRPELLYGAFRCLDCGYEMDNVEQQFKYTEPTMCRQASCNNKRNWQLILDRSVFVDWQRVRVQENAGEIPPGSMPRTLDVILRHETVEHAKAGDKCVFTGTLIVVPDVSKMRIQGTIVSQSGGGGGGGGGQNRTNSTFGVDGVSGMRDVGKRELTYRMAFLACSVQDTNTRFGTIDIRGDDDDIGDLSERDIDRIREMMRTPNLYDALAQSIAPNIFGFDDVKRGILLMLFGGVPKTTVDGMKLRGDLNVCVVGDPSTAKSQFLKYVVGFLTRAVYASGKSSTAAGLTASVTKDDETGEFCIEAGALMLADNGICCIDEFDKMDIKDQVAIHEAMEQQTISIAKAGIRATLNARTSILAACNPVSGRYDRAKTLKSNIGLTPALMSRFDLFFVMLDENDQVNDYNLARHIVGMHQAGSAALNTAFSTIDLQRYIKFARSVRPIISEGARAEIVARYSRMRTEDATGASRTSNSMTVRQLESMIRLSEALARLHCDASINRNHVLEAARLIQVTKIHVDVPDVELEDFVFDVPLNEGDDDNDGKDGDKDKDGKQGGGGGDGDGDGDGDGGDGGGDDSDGDDKKGGRGVKRAAGSDDDDGEGDGPSQPPAGGPASSQPMKDDEAETEAPGGGDADDAAKDAVPVPAGKIAITYEQYRATTQLLVRFLRRTEAASPDDFNGVTVRALKDWYLRDIATGLDSEEALHKEETVLSRIIRRLVTKDNVLIALSRAEDAKGEFDAWTVAAHPNYDQDAA